MSRIKDIPRIDRPREKMEKYGPGKLSDSELLAIILRSGTKDLSVVEISKKILRKFGREGISQASFSELKKTFGLGPVKSAEILACFELGRRFLNGKKTELILSPRDTWENLKDIRDNKKEHFVVFYLDTRNQKIQREIISVGILNANLIHPREVFEPAIRHCAAQIIICHNHPSGDVNPSQDDLEITKRLVEAGNILGIEITDHVIVSENSFLSLKCEGLL
ncbi:MAG: DNA repair protein RadC [Candidatus Moraniibacteriota bacterium]